LRDPAVASDKWVRSPLSDIPEFNTRNNSTSKFDKKSEDLGEKNHVSGMQLRIQTKKLLISISVDVQSPQY
jgi:hypothetical protein